MKVSLVQAPRWSIYTPAYAVALLTGNLRSQGFTVFPHCFDVDFHRAVSPEEKSLWLDENANFWNDDRKVGQMIDNYGSVLDHMVEQILENDPDVVGFSVKIWSQMFSLDMARRIKRRRKDVHVILGGPQMNAQEPPKFFEQYPQIDAICRQEADISLPRYLRMLESSAGRPQPEKGFAYRDTTGEIVDCGLIKEIPDVKNIPFADYSDYDLTQYLDHRAITMVLSRGCINRCSYCSEAPSFLRYRYYPPEKVMEEILHHWNTTNTSRPMRIYFNDSLINGNMKQLVRLSELLIENRDKVQIEYGGMMFIRDELMDETVVDKLVQSGLKDTLFGLETGSENVLKLMRKRFKHSTAEVVFKRFHDRNVSVVATGLFGHPGETEAEFYKSLDFLRRNAHNIDVFLLSYMGLYGDCDVSRHPEKYGVDPSNLAANDWVADEGRNTFEVRLNRTNIARMLLGHKAADHGGFLIDQKQYYDPATPMKEKVAQLETRVEQLEREVTEADELRKESIRIRNYVRLKADQDPIGWIDTLAQKPEGWIARGWARDPERPEPAKEVILVNQHGRVVSYGRVKFDREDVQQAFQSEDYRRSGWEAVFYPEDLDEGRNILRAFVYLPDLELAYPLHGEVAVSAA